MTLTHIQWEKLAGYYSTAPHVTKADQPNKVLPSNLSQYQKVSKPIAERSWEYKQGGCRPYKFMILFII